MTVLTTHVGSLPRTQTVVDFIFAREHGTPYDQAGFDACMTAAVSETVRKQKEAGVDIVSDGETSKISYATYVKDRYTGFDGDSPRNAPADLRMFPGFLKRIADSGGTPQYARPMCVGEVKSKGQGELEKDIANLTAAMAAHGAERGFMNAASPGLRVESGGNSLAASAERFDLGLIRRRGQGAWARSVCRGSATRRPCAS